MFSVMKTREHWELEDPFDADEFDVSELWHMQDATWTLWSEQVTYIMMPHTTAKKEWMQIWMVSIGGLPEPLCLDYDVPGHTLSLTPADLPQAHGRPECVVHVQRAVGRSRGEYFRCLQADVPVCLYMSV
jgi:hypothetical protein